VSKKRYTRSEYGSYQPNNPLTQHYISTGAILPEKEEQPIVVKRKRIINKVLKQTLRS